MEPRRDAVAISNSYNDTTSPLVTLQDPIPRVYQQAAENEHTWRFFKHFGERFQALTCDEVTLADCGSTVHPADVQTSTWFTRHIRLAACGLISAAMDTVTEAPMALAMAKLGGIGILHRNLEAADQARAIQWVRHKIHSDAMITKPVTVKDTDTISQLKVKLTVNAYPFSTFPVVDARNKLVGLITNHELEFVTSHTDAVSHCMKPVAQLYIAVEGTTSQQAYELMASHHVKTLPIVNAHDELLGMYTWKDVKRDQHHRRAHFSLDADGHFLVGAAIGFSVQDFDRAKLLVAAGCKVLVLDSSHAACEDYKQQMMRLRDAFGDMVDIVVGNIASYASATYLFDRMDERYWPDAIKVGIGPGSICTTRLVTGHGVPQLTAVHEVAEVLRELKVHVPIIADGGIRTSGDIVKLIAAGASSFMMGSVFAGTDESPGKIIFKDGKTYKKIRGMGSRAAMEERDGSRQRYNADTANTIDGAQSAEDHALTTQQKAKLVPEGVEGLVEYRGSVAQVVAQLVGGVRAGLAHSGAATIEQLPTHAHFWYQSSTGLAEGKPHDIHHITQ